MARNEVTRRRFLQMAMAMGGAGMLAACGGAATVPAQNDAAEPTVGGAATVPAQSAAAEPTAGGAAATGSDGAVTLDILNENWGDIYNNLMTVIGDEFTKENPNITLSWNFDPDWTTKLATLTAAGTPPDATIMRAAPLTTFAAKGSLTDLTPLLQQTNMKREDFITPLYDSGMLDGKLYAIPGGADYWAMFYNKDVYRDVGLDPEKPPTTFAELIAHSKKILQKDANGDIQRIGFNPSAGFFANWAYIFGGELYDAANRKVTANHPANVEALTQLAAYVKELDVNKLAAFNQRPGTFEAGNPFASKQAAFIFDGFWTYEALDQHAPDIDYGVTFWPTLKGTPEERANYMIGGWHYAIPTGSKNTDAAWKFIRYAFIDHSAEMGIKTVNGTCVRSQFKPWEEGVRAKMGADNRLAPYLSVFTDTGAVATKFFPTLSAQAFYQDELSRVYDLVVRGETTPQAGLDEVTKNVQAELDKAA
jgi:multiple sugar transport system substrate-binding protein